MTSSTSAPVLFSRSLIRLISMQHASAMSQALLPRMLPPPIASTRMAAAASSRCSLNAGSFFGASMRSSGSFAASVAGRGGSTSFSTSFSAAASSSSASSSSSFSSSSASPRPPPEGTLITSSSNPFVKHCAKLRTSPSARSEAGATLLAGSTIISEVCGGGGGKGKGRGGEKEKGSFAPRVLFLAPEAEAPEGVPKAELTLRAPAEVLAKLAGLATTIQGATSLSAVAVVDLPAEAEFSSISISSFSSSSAPSKEGKDKAEKIPPLRRLLALDGVQDPGNVGTLIRTALALGWDGLYCLPGTADPWGDKSVRAARGAAWRLPVRGNKSGSSWGELLEVAKGAGLDFLVAEPREEEEEEEEESGRAPSSRRGVCLVLGSEGSGLSAEGRAALASLKNDSFLAGVSAVSIPMAGEMESLNVATAGAVLMFALSEGAGEFVRGLERKL